MTAQLQDYIDITISKEVKLRLFQAIDFYCNAYEVNVNALKTLLTTAELTPIATENVRQAIESSQRLPKHRIKDICDLLKIIDGAESGTSAMVLNLKNCLEGMSTGWWIFKGKSKLAKYFNEAFQEINAAQADTVLMGKISHFLETSQVSAQTSSNSQIIIEAGENEIMRLQREVERYRSQVESYRTQLDEMNAEHDRLARENLRLAMNQLNKEELLGTKERLEKRQAIRKAGPARSRCSSSPAGNSQDIPMQTIQADSPYVSFNSM